MAPFIARSIVKGAVIDPARSPATKVKTSCPRLTIWEDAVDAGLVVHLRAPGEPATVGVTDKGLKMLETRHASRA